MKLIALVATLVIAFALPASANYLLNAKGVCYDENNGKLVKAKLTGADVIARCLGVLPAHPSVAEHALTFDYGFSQLQVVRRCDLAVICDLSTQLTCETAPGATTKRACIYRLLDFGTTELEGTMLCQESDKYNMSTHTLSFKAKCAGSMDLDGNVCALAFSTGRELPPTTCPP